jgi:K+-transporting ATPase ATPase C chain
MLNHLRGIVLVMVLTVVLCCIVYPAILWAVGAVAFPEQARGSILHAKAGTAVGSRLIAQPFTGKEFFHPRPSAVSYNAAASGASNWAASNPLLRDRVARSLGLIARYDGRPPHGNTVQEDVRAWFASQPDPVAAWVDAHPSVVSTWAGDDKCKDAIKQWADRNPHAMNRWKKENPGNDDPQPSDLAATFFTANAKAFHETWPNPADDSMWSVEAVFFDDWLQDPANHGVKLKKVPADLVTTSGSGLDPHITLDGALYQLDDVAEAWATETKTGATTVKKEIETLLRENASAPLYGLAGAPLINVLEVNRALLAKYRGS